MCNKFFSYVFLVLLIDVSLFYYVLSYCSIYPNSNKEWLYSSICGFLMNLFVIKPTYSLIKLGLRFLSIKYKDKE